MRRILLVDDESGFTRLVKLTLEGTGRFEVLEINNARQTLATAKRFQPDLIFLDIVMPEIDGGDVAASLQRDPTLRRIPIVFLTAIVSKNDSAANETVGGFPFLAKPVSLDELIGCIDQHLGPE